jgi:signal transduction histidine kinase
MNLKILEFRDKTIFALLIIAGIAFLYYISTVNYLLFHGIAEFWSIVVACCFFMIAWNVKDRTENSNLVCLGIAYLFIAFLDLIHTLAYKGMNIFNYDYYASDLWVASRYMESISLCLFFSISNKKRISYKFVFGVYFCITALIILSIHYWKIFPVCFIEGKGQTAFKIYSEYIICAFLAFSLVILYIQKSSFEKNILKLLLFSVVLTIAAELCFSFYVNVYGFSNFAGHIFKLISFYLMYKAIIENGLRQPFKLIFKELKEKEELLNTTQKIAQIGGWASDLTNNTMTWTEETYRIREVPFDYDVTLENALSFYPEDSARKFMNAYQRLENEGGTDDLELQMTTAKKKNIWVRVTFEAEREQEKTVRISGIIQDITKDKKIEQLKADYERIMRHDLKTPVNSIYMAAQLLEEDIPDTTALNSIKIIQDSAYELMDMINISLNLSRIEEGEYKISVTTFDLRKLLLRAIKEQEVTANVKGIKGFVTINGNDIHNKLPPFEVKGEISLFHSMLSNLYKNALEASPYDEILEIIIEEKTDIYTIQIKNKGAVPLELRDNFFEKYSSSGKENGTGLGAYSSKLIAELHKGKISMTSSEEAGTAITIELPKNLE